MLEKLAIALSDTQRPSLRELVSLLEDQGVLAGGDTTANAAFQLVFSAIGWITLLFDPVLAGPDGVLSILSPADSSGVEMNTEILDHREIQIEEAADMAIHQVFKYFGDLIPFPPYRHSPTGQRFGVQYGLQSSTNSLASLSTEYIAASYLNYYTLFNIAQMKLEFTSSISMHLEFDEITSTLKIFRYPSFCALVCSVSKTDNRSQQSQFLKW